MLQIGQTIGFPIANILPPVLGLAIAGAAKQVYGVNGWNLLPIFALWPPAVDILACLVLAVSVLITNLVCRVGMESLFLCHRNNLVS